MVKITISHIPRQILASAVKCKGHSVKLCAVNRILSKALMSQQNDIQNLVFFLCRSVTRANCIAYEYKILKLHKKFGICRYKSFDNLIES